jgi:hypothetical protein
MRLDQSPPGLSRSRFSLAVPSLEVILPALGHPFHEKVVYQYLLERLEASGCSKLYYYVCNKVGAVISRRFLPQQHRTLYLSN